MLSGKFVSGRTHRFVSWTRRAASTAAKKQRLVVLGSGWAGYNVARKVDKTLYDVTVVSPNSYFSFTPFLASTAVGTLEYRCATEPVRAIKEVRFSEGWARNIDFAKKVVQVKSSLPATALAIEAAQTPGESAAQLISYDVPYDNLVIAVGCFSASFGIPGVKENAHFLKDIRDARTIRTRLLECLEQASLPQMTAEERRNLLSFRIVGGGPTGVEFAAELHDFVHDDVYRLYPHLRGEIEITLYDVAPGILMSFDAGLREYAERKFARTGVTVKGNSSITAVGKDWIEIAGKDRYPFGLLVWSTGLQANPFVDSLSGVLKDEKTKSLEVNGSLSLLDEDGKAIPGVFAIGDNCTPAGGPRLPATAQVASQMAKHLSKTLNLVGNGKPLSETPPFAWKNRGSMVFIGDYRAMVDRSKDSVEGPKSRLAGISAWILWRSYYMMLAMGWRNKLLVPTYWALAWAFGRDVTRF
ncbi:NADH:quinone reductase (non-electrogenic), partial [Tremellales sp. Uapishka_1]